MKRQVCSECGAMLLHRSASCPLCGRELPAAAPAAAESETDREAYRSDVRRLREELRRLRDEGAEAV